MKPPRSGYGKNYAVRWLNSANDEVMYSGAMTEEEAMRVVHGGHWHIRAYPTMEKLNDAPANSR